MIFGKIASSLKKGDVAPDIALLDQNEKLVRLSDFRGKNVVLFFYPKDESMGCTREACAFRDQYEVFKDADAEVIGISPDSSASHQRFATRNHLPFVLLADPEAEASRTFGVGKTLGLIPGRVSFVIDKQGVVQHVFSSQAMPLRHVTEALRILQELE